VAGSSPTVTADTVVLMRLGLGAAALRIRAGSSMWGRTPTPSASPTAPFPVNRNQAKRASC
jgi:hypothetical protein